MKKLLVGIISVILMVSAMAIFAFAAEPCTEHVYASDCDVTCDVCGEERTAEGIHGYARDCDSHCNKCGYERTVDFVNTPHWDDDSNGVCDFCQEKTADASCNEHTYSGDCDAYCNRCGEKRDVDLAAHPHTLTGACDTLCDVCWGIVKSNVAHTFDGASDEVCNVCATTRKITSTAYTKCTYKISKINGVISTASNCWVVSPEKLNDGDRTTGGGSSHTGEDRDKGVNRWLTFEEPVVLEKLLVAVNCREISVLGDDGFRAGTMNSGSNQDHKFTLVLHRDASTTNRAYQVEFNSKGKILVEFNDLEQYGPIKMIEVWNWGPYDNGYLVFEIEPYVVEGDHAWELVETITPPKCNETGEGIYKCECGAEKTDIIPKTAHAQGANWVEGMIDTENGQVLGHYYECENDGCTDKLRAGAHEYDGDCDDTCNVCGMTRTATAHQYGPSECDELCNGCGLKRDVDLTAHPHTYSHDCDAFCDACGDGERTPLADHNVDGDCDLICNDCGNETGATASHTYDNKCDDECNVCGHVRTAVTTDPNYDSSYDPDHVYTSDCDDYCNECGAEINLAGSHNYSHECQQICAKCKEVRTATVPHTYDVNDLGKSCDTSCNVCRETRDAEIDHVYDNSCDEDCNVCGHVRTKDTDSRFTPNHTYSGACDKVCDSCDATRKVNVDHTYENKCDASCEVCGNIRSADEESANYDEDYIFGHVYDNSCDGICNECNAQRTDEAYTKDHVWSSDCDKECNVCGKKRTVEPHKYEFDCSTMCSVKGCGQKRQAEHAYDNACDATCKFCNETTREVDPHEFPSNSCTAVCKNCGVAQVEGGAHTFGEWVQTTAPERKTNGVNTRVCSVCGATETQDIPALGGISGGAVAGIVIGSVAVVGVGGFSVFWFGIKKNSFGDLVNVFKKKK